MKKVTQRNGLETRCVYVWRVYVGMSGGEVLQHNVRK